MISHPLFRMAVIYISFLLFGWYGASLASVVIYLEELELEKREKIRR